MAVKVTWRGNKLGLTPTWIVDEVRVHTVKNYEYKDGTKADTMVVYFKASAEQMRILFRDYSQGNIPHGILGLNAIPLIPNACLWTYEYKDFGVKEEYFSFEVTPIEDKAPDTQRLKGPVSLQE